MDKITGQIADFASSLTFADLTGDVVDAATQRLVDAIGGETEALAWLKAEKGIDTGLPVRDVKVRREVADWLEDLGSLARKATFSERLTLDGLISLWHPDIR